MASGAVKVLLEHGKSKVFAIAVDWPGWARSGKSDEPALEALGSYATRYGEVVGRAGQPLPSDVAFEVVEDVSGGGATDFGVPGQVAAADGRRWTAGEAARQMAIMKAAWAYLDEVVSSAPATLRKGPRGGGRDRDEIVRHVVGAEAAYGRAIGVKHKEPPFDDHQAIAALRSDLVDALSQPSDGSRIGGPKGWPARYAVRRIVWHTLDHAWEIQDKS
jgi:hypothetical protein